MFKFTGALVVALAALFVLPLGASAADNGYPNASPTLSFFSGGGGAHAGWVATDDQPPGDTDNQAIQIHDTTASYAGVLVHHVYGWPTASFPNSSFWFTSDLTAASLGYPRLVIQFSDGGNAALRPLTWQPTWSEVQDPNWDNNAGGICGFQYEVTWQVIQSCHPGTFITNEYITTDPGIDVDFLIDDLYTAGKFWSSASDNAGDGADNTTATFTPDLDALLMNPASLLG